MPEVVPLQRSSESAAFEVFYRAVVPYVRRYAERHVGLDLADDVVAEAFVAVWNRWETLPTPDDERRAWAFGAARLAIKVVVRRGRDGHTVTGVVPEALERPTADHADVVAADDRVARLLSGLPSAEFDAMWLVIWADLSPTEAARALDCSVSALTSRLARGRQRLRVLLDGEARAGEGVDRVR